MQNKIMVSVVTMLAVFVSTTAYIANASVHYAHENFSSSIRHIPQNALNWVNPATQNTPLFSAQKQQAFASHYLNHYFAPWHLHVTDPHFADLKNINRDWISHYLRYPGYGINHLPNAVSWIRAIEENMNMAKFPNVQRKVITVRNANLRNLPTHQPSFSNFHEAGQGYPFDNLQATSVAANTPAFVVQTTRDGAWSFVITHNSYGWVPTPDLATVDDAFIKHWETGHYVALTKNHVAMVDHDGIMRFKVGVGKIFPVNNKKLLLAIANTQQKAVITYAPINVSVEKPWPLLPTPIHIAQIMNAMLGVKYGWGGINDDSDCSLTTMNLFATFGMWLPRNSASQAYAGHVIRFTHQNAAQKTETIKKYGVPFLTLLHIPYPGHIVVYLGEKKGRVYIFQTVWGADTDVLGDQGRAIIGTTAITPADLGRHALNVPKTWLDKMNQMVLLGE